jgi:6-phosphogluconolactonase (cycloisomerase 2 family)
MTIRSVAALCTSIVLAALAACSGGGGGGEAPPPAAAITAQPSDQSVVAGATATFTVVASNATGYQWEKNSGAGFSAVAGATGASHTTAATVVGDHGTQYRVLVSGVSSSLTSSAATLSVTAAPVAPAIAVHPASQTVTAGQDASFSVTASGTALAYQWQRSTDSGVSFAALSGETNATLTRQTVALADNGHLFRVVVSNALGTLTSNAATLGVNPAPAIPAFTAQPQSQSVIAPATATFTVSVTGTPAPTLQWQVNSGAGFADIQNATGTSYTTAATSAADHGKQYRVMATNPSASITSNAATLSVAVPAAPSFTLQPAHATVSVGQNITFTAAVTGTPTPALQWQFSQDGGLTWFNFNAQTSTSLTLGNLEPVYNGWLHRAVASNSVATVNSNAARLTVLGVPRFAYVSNVNDNTVSMYTVNAATGQLRHNGYVTAPIGPQAIAVHPNGRSAYVASSGGVFSYTVNAGTGALTNVGSLYDGTSPYSVTVDPSGKFAYAANFGSANVSSYMIDAASGTLSSSGTVASGSGPLSVTVDRWSKFAYVAANDGSIGAYTIDPATGALTLAGNVSIGASLRSVTADPFGRFVYATRNTGQVWAFSINPSTGLLSAVPGSPFTTGDFAVSVSVDPTGRFAYVANFNTHNVSAFAINANTGALSAIGTYPAGTNPSFVNVDASGKFVYVTNQASNTVSSYSIHAVSGALTALPAVSARNGPSSIAMAGGAAAPTYTPKFAYAANYGSSDVSVYTINAGTGTLTSAGSAFLGAVPRAVAASPSGKFVYVTREILFETPVDNVHAFTADPTSGALASAGSPPGVGSNPASVVVEPSGRFAYVAYEAGGGIGSFGIHATTGALTFMSVAGGLTGEHPGSVAVDPAGRFVYAANNYAATIGSGTVSANAINPGTGALTAIDLNGATAGVELITGPDPTSVIVDPSGRFVYVTHANGVTAYAIDLVSGALINASSVAAGANPRSIGVEPSGRFAYVANGDSHTVSVFSIDAVSGALTAASTIGGVANQVNPWAISADPSGKFLYLANAGSHNVSVYTINAVSGVLSFVGNVAAGTGPVSITTTGTMQ